MKLSKFAAALAMASLVPATAAAQTADYRHHGLVQTEGRVSVGFTLPFGGTQSDRTPQLELRMIRDTMGPDGQRRSNLDGRMAGSRIGISLDGHSRWLFNRRPVTADERRGISTLGGIAIGVGVAVVLGGLLLADAARDASE